MHFNEHSELKGLHAFLSPSQYHWIRYSDDKLEERYANHLAKVRGTMLHEFAAQAISLGIKLKGDRTTLAMYVNDAIGFKMTPEQPLYYSDNCFGTADAISFRKNLLRIHDLKTGAIAASMSQLEVYAAIFCLEYQIKPGTINMELRIYQDNKILIHNPKAEEILPIMDLIVRFDEKIERMKMDD